MGKNKEKESIMQARQARKVILYKKILKKIANTPEWTFRKTDNQHRKT